MDPRLLDLQDQNSGEHQGVGSTDAPPLSNAHWNDFDEFIIDELPHVESQSGLSGLGPQAAGEIPAGDQPTMAREHIGAHSAGVPFDAHSLYHDSPLVTDSSFLPLTNLHGDQSLEDPTTSYLSDFSQGSGASHGLSHLPHSNILAPDTRTPESPQLSTARSPVPGYGSHVRGQVNANQGLPRRRSRYQLCRSGAAPVFIPNSMNAPDPMQRWQDSPPEDEPASMSAIANALKRQQTQDSRRGRSRSGSGANSPKHDAFRDYRRPKSTASSISGTSASSNQSASSSRSATSAGARNGLGPSKSHGRVRKTRRDQTKGPTGETHRLFCCTFCCDRFKTKYDWVRHEGSLHLNLRSWVCTPHGGSVVSSLTGRQHCAYCNALDPAEAHLEQHNNRACLDKTRTFRRKDHLVQHLRLTHHLDTIPLIDDWKIDSTAVTSRCGFCDHRLESWDERTEHLANHFRQGTTMDDWRGEHDFPSSVAAKVTNNLPPYLIGAESRTMVPFSATNSTVKDHFAQISSRADQVRPEETRAHETPLVSSFQQLQTNDVPLSTFAQILTSHLSRFARNQMEQGVLPTDEMFQQESRRVLYDSEDSWNQTVADNPEWLSDFRRQHLNKPQDTQPGIEDN
ncbi:hypothetical protein P170DRAFT_476475 [Aspergillus steynii IBT 23096]|uniref:C2H2-type domain-containing protein n=1 Tax=Aspergillus steynii IBT 23096 TaxID=1392250 RepID=A0A2I2G4J8_9EURO|nr:uncharacterized protein P170DRAFT_476475 [Aspergillus steynii IBT 23096]PLB47801.1 hypothetical protein P170DRAFT_476475 [Aspergillus steynii IBT 23096]